MNSFSEAFGPIVGGAISTAITLLGEAFQGMAALVNQASATIIQPALAVLLTVWQGLMTGIQNAWTAYGQPLLEWLAEAFRNLAGHLPDPLGHRDPAAAGRPGGHPGRPLDRHPCPPVAAAHPGPGSGGQPGAHPLEHHPGAPHQLAGQRAGAHLHPGVLRRGHRRHHRHEHGGRRHHRPAGHPAGTGRLRRQRAPGPLERCLERHGHHGHHRVGYITSPIAHAVDGVLTVLQHLIWAMQAFRRWGQRCGARRGQHGVGGALRPPDSGSPAAAPHPSWAYARAVPVPALASGAVHPAQPGLPWRCWATSAAAPTWRRPWPPSSRRWQR